MFLLRALLYLVFVRTAVSIYRGSWKTPQMLLHLRAGGVICVREVTAAVPGEGLNPAAFPLAKLPLKKRRKVKTCLFCPSDWDFP